MSETKFEDLTISNDFMFKEVMKSNKGLCKRLVGSIMQQDIEDIVYIERGYDDIVSKLKSVGADIRKVTVKEDF